MRQSCVAKEEWYSLVSHAVEGPNQSIDISWDGCGSTIQGDLFRRKIDELNDASFIGREARRGMGVMR
jgi:hypothetical protein